MKYSLLFVLCLVYIHPALSQVLTDEQQVLLKFIQVTTKEEPIVYVHTVYGSGKKELAAYIESTNATVKTKEKEKNTIFLSKKEQRQLLNALDDKSVTIWSDSLFKNSVMIEKDSMMSYVKAADREFRTKMDNAVVRKDSVNILKYRKAGRPFVFVLIKPVFIRHHQICMTNMEAVCGPNCGRNELAFYRKENGEWKRWILVMNGEL